MKKQERRFENVVVEWLTFADRYAPPQKEHLTNCTIIDTGSSLLAIEVPGGEVFRKKKNSAGFRINFVPASLGKIRVSQLREEDRQEVLSIFAQSRDGYQHSWVHDIVRKGEVVALGECRETEEMRGRFGELFG